MPQAAQWSCTPRWTAVPRPPHGSGHLLHLSRKQMQVAPSAPLPTKPHTINGKAQLIWRKCMDSTHDSPVCRPAYKAPSLNYALTVRAASIPGGWRTSEEAVMFINVQPVPWQHTSSHTINQPLTADVHLSPLRVMEVSLRDNSAGEAGLAVRPPESVIPRAGCEPIRVRRIISHQAEHPGHGKPCFHLIIYL